MAEAEPVVVSSTVVLPDQESEENGVASQKNKRRASSASNDDIKRARLDFPDKRLNTAKKGSSRNGGIDIEERKRGKRLFGGLLGALSQNSFPIAPKRRIDVERKEQDKLKVQASEDNEAKRKRLEKLNEARKEQQKIWEKQAQTTRHQNERNLAHFLKTETLPILYYKPWELQEEEEVIIKRQLEEIEHTMEARFKSEAAIVNEAAPIDTELKVDHDEANHESVSGSADDPTRRKTNLQAQEMAVDDTLTMDDSKEEAKAANRQLQSPNPMPISTTPDTTKDNMDTEEVIHQGDEDAVLY